MIKRIKRGVVERAHPLWLRVLAMACLFLVVGASSVQAVHVHGQWLPQHATHAGSVPVGSQGTGGEEHCPLCLAMHSALPVSSHVHALRLTLVECKVVQSLDHAPETHWHYAMFSRPPPAENL